MGFKALAILAALGVTAGVTASVTDSRANIKINQKDEIISNLTTQLENEKTDKQKYYEALVESAKTLEAKEILIENLTADLAAAQTDLTQTQSDLNLKQNELNSKVAELNAANASVAGLQEALTTVNADKALIQEQLEAANTEVDRLTELLTAANTDKASIQEQLNLVNLNVQNLQSLLDAANAEKLAVEGQLTSALEEISSLENTILTITSERDALQLQVDSLLAENAELRNTIALLESQLNQPQTTSPASFAIVDGKIGGYLGTEEDIIVPTSYSISGGETLTVNSYSEFESAFSEKNNSGINDFILTSDQTSETIHISALLFDDFMVKYTSGMLMTYCEKYSPCNLLYNFELVHGNDYQITEIVNQAFKGNNVIKSVKFLEPVTFGEDLFYQCSNLTTVELPEGITQISKRMFCECSNLTTVNIPDSVTSLVSAAFYGCSSLKDIVLPEGLITIDYGIFYGCSSLTELTIPSTVTSIGAQQFANCTGLTEITVLAEVPPSFAQSLDTSKTIVKIYIPAGTKTAYENADGWKDLLNQVTYIEIGSETYPELEPPILPDDNEEPEW